MVVASFEGLVKEYPTFRLDGVTFSLEEGTITGFIGRNGAGKTTTIKSVLNLIHPTAGKITYFGMPLEGNEAEIKGRIGYSTGAVNYYPKKKLRQIVSVTKRFYPTFDEAAYREYLDLFGLDEEKTPSELSEGMKVKFNLLLALSHKAEILILDEPTSGLDPFSRDELLEIFKELRSRGIAILFSTHVTSDLEKCADRIVYIRKGKIIASMEKETFRKTYSAEGESLEDTVLRLEREANR